jgi:hypothetical protein
LAKNRITRKYGTVLEFGGAAGPQDQAMIIGAWYRTLKARLRTGGTAVLACTGYVGQVMQSVAFRTLHHFFSLTKLAILLARHGGSLHPRRTKFASLFRTP